ncbi:MAG: cytochrome c [Acidobacteriales bacterium]|nr:cytochrome c [Terriglobales bacterium]
MKSHVRVWGLAIALAGLAGLVLFQGLVVAGDEKAVQEAVRKIAEAIKNGDKEGAVKQATALSKKVDTLEEVMDVLKPRSKGGLGVGKPGQVTPDGIWLKVIGLGRDGITVVTLKKEADALEEMSYIIAAVSEVAKIRAPAKDKGKQTKKEWLSLTEDMRSGSLKLAAAAKSKSAQEIKTAANKLNASCNTCHSTFR